MRLKLTIQRNCLPSVDLVWTIPAETAHPPQTVANLLEQVNEAFPLEAEDWGLEDYVVEVGGFECLHFSSLSQVLREDDHVRIRPLQTPEVRARRLSGRDQISRAGVHLLDGMPFGKSSVRRPSRPEIRIPPRKRARLLPPVDNEDDLGKQVVGTSAELNGHERTEDVENNGIGEASDEAESSTTEPLLLQGSNIHTSNKRPVNPHRKLPPRKRARILSPTKKNVDRDETSILEGLERAYERASGNGSPQYFQAGPHKNGKKVRFEAGERDNVLDLFAMSDEDDGDEDEDEDYTDEVSGSEEGSGEDAADSDRSNDTSSPSDSDSDSDSTSVTSSNLDAEPDVAGKLVSEKNISEKQKAKAKPHGSRSPESESGSDTSSSDSEPEVEPISKVAKKPPTRLPYDGRGRTKSRNDRRRRSTLLHQLKTDGKLTPTASFAELETYFENLEHDSQAASLQDATDAHKATKKDRAVGLSAEERRDRDVLLQDLANGGIDVTPLTEDVRDIEGQGKVSSKSDKLNGVEVDGVPNKARIDDGRSAAKKRTRLDVQGSRRVLFNSLGLRAPKSKADEEALKTKLFAQSKRKPIKFGEDGLAIVEDPEPVTSTDVNAWKSKIVLNAVECCDEDIVLSTPPFPFIQRWDPQQQISRGLHGHNGMSSRKRKRRQRNRTDYYQDYAGYEEEADEVFDLNYDDEEQKAIEEPQTVEGAAYVDDLPSLPTDVTGLRVPSKNDLKLGDIIVFKQLDCSPETKWQPLISNWRTGTVESIDDAGQVELILAKRDRSQREIAHDEHGKRIYGKFEMEADGDDDDETDDGYRSLALAELIDLRLLQEAPEGMDFALDTKKDGTPAIPSNSGEEPPAATQTANGNADFVQVEVAVATTDGPVAIAASS